MTAFDIWTVLLPTEGADQQLATAATIVARDIVLWWNPTKSRRGTLLDLEEAVVVVTTRSFGLPLEGCLKTDHNDDDDDETNRLDRWCSWQVFNVRNARQEDLLLLRRRMIERYHQQLFCRRLEHGSCISF
jgi:hypothetical protein